MQAEDVIGNLLREYAIDGPVSQKASEPETGKSEASNEEQVSTLVSPANQQNGDSRPRFNNIVAIVDPPRVGLHHVVSKVAVSKRFQLKYKHTSQVTCYSHFLHLIS